MSSTSMPMSSEAETVEQQRRLLALARNLDRFGRRAEQMLLKQFEQLELALEDFECEKSAWRRQQQREAAELERMRQELLQDHQTAAVGMATVSLQEEPEPIVSRQASATQSFWTEADAVEQAARDSGAMPLRILLQPGSASALQLGLLMFEISQLNRELGGAGVRFEMAESRQLRRGIFGQLPAGLVLELDGFSAIPLTNADTSAMEMRGLNEDLAIWTDYKTRLLLAACNDRELEVSFRRARIAPRPPALRTLILEATRRAEEGEGCQTAARRTAQSLPRSLQRIDPIRQQQERLESCVECLNKECGLKLLVSLR